MSILVTGGTGYIGSHTAIDLLEQGEEVIILDNFCNSSPVVAERIREITGQDVTLYKGDIRDANILRKIFHQHDIDSVIHFAGLKAVGESTAKPILYYENNVGGTLVLLEEMERAGVREIIFSSSATVYGTPVSFPINESAATGGTTNPYGTSKYMLERILCDLHTSNPAWSVVILRYFNPVGAHPSGRIGELPNGIPNNLLPYICQVASGTLQQLSVFGNDYPTVDGTGVRDYIHVMDLASGHVKARQRHHQEPGVHIYNLGTGKGYSVLEIVDAFERINQVHIPYQIVARRPGDIATCYADPQRAGKELGWHAERTLEDMMRDAWHWQTLNPHGYEHQEEAIAL